ncbi:hypothetical protein SANTM175S_01694 [Streptomyces antimycoticus]
MVIPSATSWIFTSLHVSFGFALIGAIVGEYIGATKGLGLLVSAPTDSSTGGLPGASALTCRRHRAAPGAGAKKRGATTGPVATAGRPSARRTVCRGLRGDTQMQIVARMQPLAVYREIGHHDRAGHLQGPARPESAGQLGGQMEHRDDDVRPLPLHQVQQPVLGERRQWGAPRPGAPAGAEERPVDALVHHRRTPDVVR